jgi:hypothetical protein
VRHQLPGVAPWAHGVCHRAAESTCVASAPARSNSPSSSLPSTLSTCSPSSRSTSLSVSAKGRSAVRTHVLRRVLAARAAPCRALPRLAAPCRALPRLAAPCRALPRRSQPTPGAARTRQIDPFGCRDDLDIDGNVFNQSAVGEDDGSGIPNLGFLRVVRGATLPQHSTHLHPHLDRSTAPTCPA